MAATLVAAMFLSACESETKSTPETGQRVYYKCAGNRGFFAAFNAEGASVALEFADRRVTLPQVPSASGATYGDGAVSLYTKGDDAFLEEKGEKTYSDCVGQVPAQ